MLKHNKSITVLNLDNNNLKDKDIVSFVLDKLKNNESIVNINLENNNLNDQTIFII